MSALSNVVKHALSNAGLAIGWKKNLVEFGRFRSLMMAYESLLNETSSDHSRIPANNLRFDLIADLLGANPYEAYAVIEALAKVRDIEGDVCDFGAGEGRVSVLMANEIAQTGSSLHLFDSFEGLSMPTQNDHLLHDVLSLGSIEAYAGKLGYPQSLVEERLQKIGFPRDRYRIHKGFIEQVIPADKQLPARVSFAYVDCDFYEPVRIALDFLRKASAVGSAIIVDDYDYFTTGPKIAVESWLIDSTGDGQTWDRFVADPALADFVRLTRTA